MMSGFVYYVRLSEIFEHNEYHIKKDITLPPRFTGFERASLVGRHLKLYKGIRDQALDYLATVEDPDSEEARAHLIKMLMELEKVCLLPALIDKSYKKPVGWKFETLVVSSLASNGQSDEFSIIFCTYPEVLMAIGKYLRGKWGKDEDEEERKRDERRNRIAMITGETSPEEIQRIIEDVNSGKVKVMFVSDDAIKNLSLRIRPGEVFVLVHYNLPWQVELMEERLRCVCHPTQTSKIMELILLIISCYGKEVIQSVEAVKWEMIEERLKFSDWYSKTHFVEG
jgi:hypothetical protein